MNAWFPQLRADGLIASGNDGIWITDAVGSKQLSLGGTNPVWAAGAIVFNLKDGTTYVGGDVVPVGYNEYRGADDGRWAGFIGVGDGRTDVYSGSTRIASEPNICVPRFGGSRFAYLTPYQSRMRNLVVDNVIVTSGLIMEVQMSRGGEFYVYQVATGTYTRQIFNDTNQSVSIRDDETPLIAFIGPNREQWMVSNTQDGAFVRPLNSPIGYLIEGDLYYPDARMLDGKLCVVASFSNGTPRFDEWIDFNSPRRDLRQVTPVQPTIPTFLFDHPVLIAPFKDQGQGGTQYRMEDGSLGLYVEKPELIDSVIAQAEVQHTRVLCGHDSPDVWTPPTSLREWDIPFIELYGIKGEAVSNTVERWRRNTFSLLASLEGTQQCGVIPMFYLQFNPDTGKWLWTEQEALEFLNHLSEIVNISPRIVVIAPFAYERANGITGFPATLGVAFNNLKAAATPGVILVPIPGQPTIPPKPISPNPQPPTTPYPAARPYKRTS